MFRRSQLYVPGNNPHMIQKSIASEADSVILDLEDSVPTTEKITARSLVGRSASELDWRGKEICVRINSPDTINGKQDIEELRRVEMIDTLVIPKSESDLSWLHDLTGKRIIPLVETVRGFSKMSEIAASRGVEALSYGAADFAASVGGTPGEYLQNPYVKTAIVITARYFGVDPIDNVFFNLKNVKEFRKQAAQARELGYIGKQLIHPSQVIVANQVFSESAQRVVWAKKVVTAFERARAEGIGAIRVDDHLVDDAQYRAAKDILAASDHGKGARGAH